MKKFLALILALVFAFSAATMAFAASNTCPHCGKEIASESKYNQHLLSECPALYGDHTYYCTNPGCSAHFQSQDEYYNHIENTCLFREETNRDKVEDFFLDLDLAEIMETINNLLAKINFSDILFKIIDLIADAV